MRVNREFEQEDVVQCLETINEDILALLLANIPGEQEPLTEWQRQGVLAAIAEMESGKGIPHDEIVAETERLMNGL